MRNLSLSGTSIIWMAYKWVQIISISYTVSYNYCIHNYLHTSLVKHYILKKLMNYCSRSNSTQ